MAGKSLMDKHPNLRGVVARMIVNGQSNIEIATALGSGVRGVTVHKDTVTDYRRHPDVAAEILVRLKHREQELEDRINASERRLALLTKQEESKRAASSKPCVVKSKPRVVKSKPRVVKSTKLPAWRPRGYVYFIAAVGENCFKVGISKSPADRLHALQATSPLPLELMYQTPGTYKLEEALHKALPICGYERLHGEWFKGQIVASFAAMFCQDARASL